MPDTITQSIRQSGRIQADDIWSGDRPERIQATRDRLPAHSLDIWDQLEERSIAAEGTRKQMREAAEDILADLRHYEAYVAGFEPGSATVEQKKQYERHLKTRDKLKAKYGRFQHEAASGGGAALGLLKRVNEWAQRSGYKTSFRPVHIAVPDTVEKAAKQLKLNLAARTEFLQERKDIENAFFPTDEVRDNFRRWFENVAAKGAPKVGGLFRNEPDELGQRSPGRIQFAKKFDNASDTIDKMVTDPLLTLFWVCKDTIIKAVDAKISEFAAKIKDRPIVPLKDRAAALADCDARLLALEYEECALLRVLEDGGEKAVSPRGDIGILPLLQIEIGEPAAPEDFG